MRRRRRHLALASLLAATCFVGGLTAAGSPPSDLRLFDLTTARAIVDDKPFGPTDVFAPGDEVIYLWYAADGCAIGTIVRAIWLFTDTQPPFKFGEGIVTVDRAGDWGQFNFRMAPGKSWPIGHYRVELRAGDVLMAETTFEVRSPVQTSPKDR